MFYAQAMSEADISKTWEKTNRPPKIGLYLFMNVTGAEAICAKKCCGDFVTIKFIQRFKFGKGRNSNKVETHHCAK